MSTATPAIRGASAADRAAIVDTVRDADLLPDDGVDEVADELDTYLDETSQASIWLVSTQGLEIAGVAYCAAEKMTNGSWNLLMLAVRPDHQGNGHGSALVRATEQTLATSGARILFVETSGTPAFVAQRNFYERLGYRQQGWIDDFYDDGDAKVVYAKSLAPPLGSATEPSPN